MAIIDFSTIPSGVSLSEDRIQQLSERTTETAEAFHRKLQKLQETFAEARNNYSREADDIISGSHPGDRSAAKQFAKKAAANKISKMRRSLVENSEQERAAMLEALKGYADEAAVIASVCTSPAQMLGRVALGDPKRTQYQLQLEGAGPVELETAARQSIMSNDMVLAASIQTVVDRRPKDRRPFAVKDFSERVIGDVWKRVTPKLEGIQLAYKSAVAADREFVRGRADPLTNLSLSLSRKSIAEAEGKEA